MIQLDLSPGEIGLLVEALEADLSDLRMEISNTDSLDFRDRLRERKQVIRKTLEALRAHV